MLLQRNIARGTWFEELVSMYKNQAAFLTIATMLNVHSIDLASKAGAFGF